MSDSLQAFIQETERLYKPISIARAQASWESATTGTPKAGEKEKAAQAALMRFWADPDRFEKAESFYKENVSKNPLETRQIKLIYLAATEGQQDDETIDEITRLERDIRQSIYNFRAEINGKTLNNNELAKILSKSDSSEDVQAAWKASKSLGPSVADDIRELAKIRNQVAQKQGFRDFFERSLLLDEIEEDHLMSLFSELEQATSGPYEELKAEIDTARAAHFGIKEEQLEPWHYGDPFFQSSPTIHELDMDNYFADKNPTVLSTITYDRIGLEVRDILERSDLYPRPGKDQHAFCIDIDREGDIRTLNNLEPNLRWNTTLLHELGHAIYDKYIDPDLPWFLRTPPHSLSTEAVAILMGSLVNNRIWLTEILKVPDAEADQISHIAHARERANRLIFTRWCLVMTHFERAFYADPDGDLDRVWWDLVERYQFLRKPEGHDTPDWATKYHIALFPVYYQNYELGHLVTCQLESHLLQDVGGLVGNNAAGQWLVERVLKPGASYDWAEHVEKATGEPLNTRYFVDSITS
jgi:peptidyl-dipeptidase A